MGRFGRYPEKLTIAVPQFFDNYPAKQTGVPCVASGVIEKHNATISIACNFHRIGNKATGIIAIIGKNKDDVSKSYNYTSEYSTVANIKLLSRFEDPDRQNTLYVFNMTHVDISPWDAIARTGATILSPGLSIEGLEKNVVVFTDKEQMQQAKRSMKELDISDFKMPCKTWYFQREPPPVSWISKQLEINPEFGLDVDTICFSYGVDLVKSFNIMKLSGYLKDISSMIEEPSLRLTPQQQRALLFLVKNTPKGRISRYDVQLAEELGVTRQDASRIRREVYKKTCALYGHILRQYNPIEFLKRVTGVNR